MCAFRISISGIAASMVILLSVWPVTVCAADEQPGMLRGEARPRPENLSPHAYSSAKEQLRRTLQHATEADDKVEAQRAAEALGDLCYKRGDYDEAMTAFQRSLALCTELGLQECRARSLKKVADVHYYQSHYKQAAEIYEKALAVADDLKHIRLRGAILTNVGRIYRVWGKRDKAMECQTEALRLATETGDREVEAYANNNLGNLFKDLGKTSETLEHYRRSLATAREIRDRRAEGLALTNLAGIHVQTGRYEQAVDCGKDALLIQRESGDARFEAGTLESLGSAYFAWGRYDKAEDYYLSALSLSMKMQYRYMESKILEKLGHLYAARGQFDRALQAFSDSLRIRRETKDPRSAGRCLMDIGRIMAHRGKHDKALNHFSQALELWQSIGAATDEPHDLLGGLYLDMGHLANAEEHINKSGRKSGQGRLALARGQHEAATRYYREVLESAERSGDANMRFTAYTGLGRAYEGLNDYTRAEQYYEQGVQLTEEIRSSLVPAQRAHFFDVKINGFQRCEPAHGLTRVRMKSNRGARSIDSSEVTRARAFADGLSGRNPRGYAGISQQVLDDEERLVNQVAGLRQARNQVDRETDPDRYHNLSGDIARAEADVQRFIDLLWKDYPVYASVKHPRPVSLNQSALGATEFALVYDVSEEGVGIKLIRGTEIVQTHYRKWRIAELEAEVDRFRKSFDQCDLEAFDVGVAKNLYKKLLAPVLMDVPEGSPIVVIPDGVLGLLPFEALVMEGTVTWNKVGSLPVPHGLTYVGDAYAISYYQSITALTLARRLGKQAGSSGRVLVLADPVFSVQDSRITTGSPSEQPQKAVAGMELLMSLARERGIAFPRLELTQQLAASLKGLNPERIDVRIGMEATEASLFDITLKDYSSIVFATHGYFGRDLPGIREPVLVLTLLNQPDARDGFLTMTEVMSLDLNADIVALTACQTGVGKNLAGEGIMGLGRAFQWAGARSVLTSLWSVAELPSVKLVECFFKHLKDGKPKLEALKLARKEVREGGYDHPFFWAPFILVGETR